MNSFNDEVCEYISTLAIENFSTPAIENFSTSATENFYEVCEYTSMPVTENFNFFPCDLAKLQAKDSTCKITECRQYYMGGSYCIEKKSNKEIK